MELGRNKDIKEFKPEDKPVSEINHFHIDHRDRLADKAYIGDSHENNTSKIYGEKIEKQEDKPEKNSVNNEYKNVSEVSHKTAEAHDKSNPKELAEGTRIKDIKTNKRPDAEEKNKTELHIHHRDRLADKVYIGDSHENNTSKIYGEKIEKQEDKPEKNSVNNEYKNVSEVSHITAEDPDKSNSKELDANISDKLQESLKSFEQLTWKDLPLEQKMETISEFSDLISEDRELENKPKIEFYSGGEKNDLTTYSPEDHTIYINEDSNNIFHGKYVADTISDHFIKIWQKEALENPNSPEAIEYKEMIENHKEFTEQIAKAYADDYTSKFTQELPDALAIGEKEKVKELNAVEWKGEPGNSLAVLKDQNSEAAIELKKRGLEGIEYNQFNVDFSPVAAASIKFPDMPKLFDRLSKAIYPTDKNSENINEEIRNEWQKITKHIIVDKLNSNTDDSKALKEQFEKLGLTNKENYAIKDIDTLLKNQNLTLHEAPDCREIQLVPRAIHEVFKHSGGTAEMCKRLTSGDHRAIYDLDFNNKFAEILIEENKNIKDLSLKELDVVKNYAVKTVIEKFKPEENENSINKNIDFVSPDKINTTDTDHAKNIGGYYNSKTKKIDVIVSDDMKVSDILYPIVYETLHKISYHDKKKEWAFSGLQINEKNVVTNSNSKYKNKDLFSLHTGMNEGVTQMYAERIMRNDLHNNNFKSNIYKPQAEAMQYFENIYDPQKLKDAYIRNGFNDIEKDFDSIIGKTELSYLSKFIDLMDDSIECRGEVFKIIDDYAYRKEKMEQLSDLLK